MQKNTVDIVIIGGGAVGSAIAYYLAKAGREVALLDQGEFASGSSKRCDGHAITYDSPPGYFSRLCQKSLELFPEVASDLPCDIQFEPEGLGLLVDNEADLETARANYEGKLREGKAVTWWDRQDLRHHEPNIADSVLACINFTGDAKLNPMRLAFGLAWRAKEYGAKLFPHTRVTGIKVLKNTVTQVVTDKGNFTTSCVINTAGVWSPYIGKLAGVEIPVIPRQGQILVTEAVQSLVGKNYAEFGYLAAKGGKKRPGVTPEMESCGVAFVTEPTHAGTVLIGSSRQYIGMNIKPQLPVIQSIAKRAVHFFPAYARCNAIRSYAGLRPATPDGKPVISATDVTGFYVASGHEGNGIGLSLVTGLLMQEMLCGLALSFDAGPLSLDRFKS